MTVRTRARSSGWRSWRPWLSLLVPLGIYFAASLLAYGSLAPKATVKWHGQRLLERVDLAEAPARSLLLLHSQPPAMNAGLALCLRASKVLGLPMKWVVTGVVTGVSIASILLIYFLVAALTHRSWLAAAAAVVAAFDPGFQFYRLWFLASIFVHFLVAATLFLGYRALARGCRRDLAVAVLFMTLLPNVKSVFHPAWALGSALVLVALFVTIHGRAAVDRTYAAVTALGFLLLLFAWPAKNAYLYGAFTFSSWSGVNVARGTPVRSEALEAYLRDGSTTPEIDAGLERFEARFGSGQLHILARPTRANGTRNRNHYAYLATQGELTSEALRYRVSHPTWWLQSSLVNYQKWTRATFVHPYTEEIRGPWSGGYLGLAQSIRRLAFAELGGSRATVPQGRWTLYGALLFPGLLVLATLLVARDLLTGCSAKTGVMILCLLTVGWHLIAVCLSDGAEGNRMRFGVTPGILVLATLVVARLWEAIEGRPSRRGGARPA